jgi:glutamate formiminotransferase
MPLIECVPNISEGRRSEVVDACVRAVERSVPILDVTSDRAHNRSVLTFAGEPAALRPAVLALVDEAVRGIDLRTHSGEHPRVGAVDVVPFVPLGGAEMAAAVQLARAAAQEIAERFSIPVFLYEDASPGNGRRRLEDIRRGGLDALASRMTSGVAVPDFGPAAPHPTAGVSVVGARRPLIAFNVELRTDRRDVADAIARAVRERSGGLPAVKAIGVTLAHRGTVQVSMNLTDFTRTSIARAFDRVREEADRHSVAIARSELIGLAPRAALTAGIAAHVRLDDYDDDRMILERRLEAAGLG